MFRSAARRLGALGIAVLAGATHGEAAEWRITPRIDVEEAYNDNIDLAPKGREQSDFITTISPGIGIRGDGRRVSLGLDYLPQQLIYAEHPNRDEFRQRLLGTGQVEVVDGMLFVDADASISQQAVSNRAAIGGSDLTASNNLSTVQTYSIGPELRNHLGPYADSEIRYRFSAVSVDSADVADTTTNAVSLVLRNGRYFTDLGWTLSLSDSRTDRSGPDTAFGGAASDRRLGKADLQYALGPTFSLLAGAGYEQIDDATLVQSADGPIWEVGFLFRPSRASSFRATYGERYGSPNTNVDATYQISPKTTLTATYAQTVQTPQAALSENLDQLAVDELGRLIDTRTGQPFRAGDPTFGLDTDAFRQDRFAMALRSERGRNSYRAEVFQEKREFDLLKRTEKAFGGQIGWSRQLTRATDLDFGATYTRTDFGDLQRRKDNSYSARLGVTYRVSETLRARISFGHTARDSNIEQDDVVENVVVVGLGKSF